MAFMEFQYRWMFDGHFFTEFAAVATGISDKNGSIMEPSELVRMFPNDSVLSRFWKIMDKNAKGSTRLC